FPWSLFVPAALVGPLVGRTFRSGTAFRPASRLLLCWIATIVLVFTFSSTKQDLYIFPIVAALAALIGALLDRAADNQTERGAAGWTWPVVAAALVIFFVALSKLFGSDTSPYYIRGAFTASLALLGGALAVIFYWRSRETMRMVVALGAAIVVFN